MTPLAHFLYGWIIANLFKLDIRSKVFVLLSAVLPELDAIPILFDKELFYKTHHVITHNLFAGIVFALVFTLLSKKQYRKLTVSATLIAWCVHLVADVLTTNWPVSFFWPFSDFSYSIVTIWSNNFIYGPVNFAANFIAILGTLIIFVKLKRTPLEVIKH
jgi:membrane-bound metal-dependent hydrolase YbcI (DUF457 family)